MKSNFTKHVSICLTVDVQFWSILGLEFQIYDMAIHVYSQYISKNVLFVESNFGLRTPIRLQKTLQSPMVLVNLEITPGFQVYSEGGTLECPIRIGFEHIRVRHFVMLTSLLIMNYIVWFIPGVRRSIPRVLNLKNMQS